MGEAAENANAARVSRTLNGRAHDRRDRSSGAVGRERRERRPGLEPSAQERMPPLEVAIRQLIELGYKDPLQIARELERSHEPGWILGQLAMLAEDLVTEIARKQLGQRRRGFELALRPGLPMTHANMKLAGFWIPDHSGVPSWKAADEVTPEDLDRRAAWYESFAIGVLRRAQWCRQVAALMRQEGAPVLARLRAELPPLPEPEPAP